MPTATILGLDTAAGAYLARLLGARGYAVRGVGGPELLERIGIDGDVRRDDIAVLDGDEIYDLRRAPAATLDLLRSPLRGRVFVDVDPADVALIAHLAAARTVGRFIATGRVHPHESRLGPGTSPVARIVAAAAAGTEPAPIDLASATDCGWTAEYVDAMWRMLQRPAASDLVIATGVVLTGDTVARAAAAWFKRASRAPAAARAALPADARATYAELGWRAVTTGNDLVEVLCEGAAAR